MELWACNRLSISCTFLVVNVSDVSGNGAHALDEKPRKFQNHSDDFQMMGGVGCNRVRATDSLYHTLQSVQLQDWKQQQILSASFSADIFGLLCFPRLGNIVPLLSSDSINND